MCKTKISDRQMSIALYLAAFCTMLVLTALTPLMADDYTYAFSWATGERMTSIGQIVPSMLSHRIGVNGRVFPHAIVQLFMMLPKMFFNIANAGNFVLLLFLFSKYINSNKRELILLCAAMMIWNFLPGFGQSFLWLDGAINYSWGISLFLIFLLPYTSECVSWTPIKTGLFVLLAFVAGAYSENGGISTIFIAVSMCLLRYIKARKIDWQLLLGVVAATAGFVFLLKAPATNSRIIGFSFSYIGNNIKNIFIFVKERLLIIYMIFAVELAVCICLKGDWNKIIISSVFVIAGFCSLLTFSIAVYFDSRHSCFTAMFTILAIVILLDEILKLTGKDVILAVIIALSSVLFIINMGFGLLDITSVYTKYVKREMIVQEAIENKNESVYFEIYLPSTEYSAAMGRFDLAESFSTWPNTDMAKYYGIDYVFGYFPEF